MAYSKKPTYSFPDINSTGINKIPQGRIITVDDYFSGKPKMFLTNNLQSLSDSNTIADAIGQGLLIENPDKNEVNTLLGTKANWNAVVKLTDNQTINGVKTFTSNITAPNITNLQNQMDTLISSSSYPLLTKSSLSLDITVGAGGTFPNITDGLMFLKQNISKHPNTIGKITLLSNFNDDLYLKGYPFKIFIDCNGYQLAKHLFLEKSSITFNSLKLQGQLNALISTVHIVNGADIGGNSSLSGFFGSSIVANGNSFVSISGSVILRPPETEAGIYSKASRVYLVNPSNWTQSQGQYFGYVIAGGIICADNGANLENVTTTKTNVAVNTLTPYGIIFGNIWG